MGKFRAGERKIREIGVEALTQLIVVSVRSSISENYCGLSLCFCGFGDLRPGIAQSYGAVENQLVS